MESPIIDHIVFLTCYVYYITRYRCEGTGSTYQGLDRREMWIGPFAVMPLMPVASALLHLITRLI